MRFIVPFCLLLLTGCSTHFQALDGAKNVTRHNAETATTDCVVKNNAGERLTAKFEARAQTGNPKSYVVFGKTYRVLLDVGCYSEEGIASWYGPDFDGKRTSSGETYDMNQLSAAHKTLPIPSWVLVTNLENNKQMTVRVNDRGPFHSGRIIDLSKAAAAHLGVIEKGTARVKVELIPMKLPEGIQYYIQAGAYGIQANANKEARRLAQIIGSQYVLKKDNTLYKIWLGPFSPTESQQKLEEVNKEITGQAIIIESQG